MRRNIELKARCADLEKARQAAIRAGATFQGILAQTDTYFRVPNGRLKLREIEGQMAELIWYARPDETNFRESRYILTPIAEPATALAALSQALGIRGIVKKRRELFLFENVRIHLDTVEGLGSFIEFEAVIFDASDEPASHEKLARLADALQIQDADRIAVSYSDLAGI